MKGCKDCNEKLNIGDNWTEARAKWSVYKCSSCCGKVSTNWQKNNPDRQKAIAKNSYTRNRDKNIKRHREYYQAFKDGLHHVYIVDNYAGYTENPHWREKQQRQRFGRTGFRVIHSTPIKEDALELEALLHDIGYEGKHTNSKY